MAAQGSDGRDVLDADWIVASYAGQALIDRACWHAAFDDGERAVFRRRPGTCIELRSASRPGCPAGPSLDSSARRDEPGRPVGIAVLGAGPAGLTAAYVLGLRGVRGTVYEADGVVGGIAKTVEYDGYRFDLGGHRFFTKFARVERLWQSMLGDEFLVKASPFPHLLPGNYYAYPLQTRGRHRASRPARVGSLLSSPTSEAS